MANQSIKKAFERMWTHVINVANTKIDKTSIYDGLDSDSNSKVLTAKQGKNLQSQITSLTEEHNTTDNNLNTHQGTKTNPHEVKFDQLSDVTPTAAQINSLVFDETSLNIKQDRYTFTATKGFVGNLTGTASKATNDASGNNIINTYSTKTDLNNLATTVSSHIGNTTSNPHNVEFNDLSDIYDATLGITAANLKSFLKFDTNGNLETPRNITSNGQFIGNLTGTASKATNDASGNNIVDTYSTKTDLNNLATTVGGLKNFGKIKIGDKEIVADAGVDTLSISGTNINITPNVDNDSIQFAVNTSSTTQAGIVQLNNTTNSTSTTQAATANAVKAAYDKGSEGLTQANAAATSAATANTLASTKVSKSGDSAITGQFTMTCENPYFCFVDTASGSEQTKWYIQGYQNALMLGPTSTKAVEINKDGNLNTKGTITSATNIVAVGNISSLGNVSSNGNISIKNKITMEYDSTNECLNFVFN